MIAVIWPASQKKSVESSIAQTTTANEALSPGRREALPHALDASFPAFEKPPVSGPGVFLVARVVSGVRKQRARRCEPRGRQLRPYSFGANQATVTVLSMMCRSTL
jgi:hypothetical protein